MHKNTCLFFLIILTFISAYSQENESYDLQISFLGMAKNHKIDYLKNHEKILLIVKKQTSIRKFSKVDSVKLIRLLQAKTSDSKKELVKILEDYKEYKSDTLVLKQDDLIINKVDTFVRNWNKIKKDLDMNPDKRIIIDGYTVKLSLAQNHQNHEIIFVRAPTKKSHSKIYTLISDLENYYKNEIKNPIID